MLIEDFEREYEANNREELLSVLSVRYRDASNGFWLCHEKERYPAISILVRDHLATVHFFPKERDPGSRSIGQIEELDPEGNTVFLTSSAGERTEIWNNMVIPIADALLQLSSFLIRASGLIILNGRNSKGKGVERGNREGH